jgi:hypothetical protein
MCPFLVDPCEECYVVRMDSQAIEWAIRYCGGEYEQCEIYRRLVMDRRRRGGDEKARSSNPSHAETPADGAKGSTPPRRPESRREEEDPTDRKMNASGEFINVNPGDMPENREGG